MPEYRYTTMKTIRNFILGLSVSLLFISCAKLPIQSVDAIDIMIAEGKRMHELNIALVNEMFHLKRETIDNFIKNEYTPNFINVFTSKIPPNTDLKAELPNMLKSIIPVINARRDSMQSALEINRIKLITKLGEDYNDYSIVSIELKSLMVSAIKVDEARKKFFEEVKTYSKGKIDMNAIDGSLDKFILNSGSVSDGLLKLNESFDNIINSKK